MFVFSEGAKNRLIKKIATSQIADLNLLNNMKKLSTALKIQQDNDIVNIENHILTIICRNGFQILASNFFLLLTKKG